MLPFLLISPLGRVLVRMRMELRGDEGSSVCHLVREEDFFHIFLFELRFGYQMKIEVIIHVYTLI